MNVVKNNGSEDRSEALDNDPVYEDFVYEPILFNSRSLNLIDFNETY